MAADVGSRLEHILAEQGKMSLDEAHDFVAKMKVGIIFSREKSFSFVYDKLSDSSLLSIPCETLSCLCKKSHRHMDRECDTQQEI